MNIDRRQFLGTAAALVGAGALSAPALAADPIKVGSLHDLSGGLDIYGKPMVDALTLAIEEANAAGGLLGRQLQLVNYDTQSSMQLYTQFAQQAALKGQGRRRARRHHLRLARGHSAGARQVQDALLLQHTI